MKNIFLIKKAKESNIICRNALIYYYILSADNPNSQIIKYLVNRGAKFEVHEDDFGWTPMHFWARRNNYELLELAIKGGANVDMQTLLDPKSEYNETLLFEAVSEPETYRVTQLLIELGANVNYLLTTPLDDAKGYRNKKLLKRCRSNDFQSKSEKKFNLQHMILLIAKLMEKLILIYWVNIMMNIPNFKRCYKKG
ncbi:ankyrin repeat domain-containing protein [Campylobacter coli]